MVSRLLGIILVLGLLWAVKRYFFQKHGKQHSSNHQNSKKKDEALARNKHDIDEALSILGLEEPVTESDINAAYKRLINKVHPDKGGTDHFASQLNKAKKILIKNGRSNNLS